MLTLWIPMVHQSQQTLLDLLFDILDDICDVSTEEFISSLDSLYRFFRAVDYGLLVSDFQLIKRIAWKLFIRIKGRHPELQQFLFELKIAHVRKVTSGSNPAGEKPIELELEKLSLKEDEQLKKLGENMNGYFEYVKSEQDRL